MRQAFLILFFFVRLSAFVTAVVDGEVGYRRDHLRWSISGNGVDVLSELTYRNVDIVEGRGEVEAGFLCWLVRARGATGYIFGGTEQDSDFRQSGRLNEFSRSISHLRGMSNDLSIDLGQRFSLGLASATLRVGGEWHHLHLKSIDGFRTIPERERVVDTTYRAHWAAAYAALQLKLYHLSLEGGVHLGSYLGFGNWNPRHFRHAALAYGFTLDGALHQRLCGPLFAVARVGGAYWRTPAGYHSGGGRLREAQWSSAHGSLGLALIV